MSSAPFAIIAGPAAVYIAAVGEAFVLPDVADPTSATNWVDLGMTQGGVKTKHTQTVDLIKADQRTGPVKAIRSEEGLEITFALLQSDLTKYAKILNGATVTATGRVEQVALTAFSGTDSFKITYAGVESAAYTRGSTYLQATIQSDLRTATGDATLVVGTLADAGFTITFTEGILTGKTGALSITSGVGCSGTVTETNPSQRSIKPYQGLDVARYALLVRGPSPYMNAYLQYQVPVVSQAEEPELEYMRDGNAVIMTKWNAIEDPNAATSADRFGSLVAQTS